MLDNQRYTIAKTLTHRTSDPVFIPTNNKIVRNESMLYTHIQTMLIKYIRLMAVWKGYIASKTRGG